MQETSLYDGSVTVRFNEGSHRYSISLDDGLTWDYKVGVTGVLGKTLNKEALMLWPMDEALKLLFGQDFEEITDDDGNISVKPIYNPTKASLRPDRIMPAPELQRLLEDARAAHTLKKDKGADTGRLTHAWVEHYLLSTMGNTPVAAYPDDVKATNACIAFKNWYESQPDIECVGVEQVVYSKDLDYCGTYDCLLKIDGELVLCDVKTSNYSRTAPKGIYADNFIQLGAYCWAYTEEHDDRPGDLMVINCSKQGKVNTLRASEVGLMVSDCTSMWIDTLHVAQKRDKLAKELSKRR